MGKKSDLSNSPLAKPRPPLVTVATFAYNLLTKIGQLKTGKIVVTFRW